METETFKHTLNDKENLVYTNTISTNKLTGINVMMKRELICGGCVRRNNFRQYVFFSFNLLKSTGHVMHQQFNI
jgi:hypothetical protein